MPSSYDNESAHSTLQQDQRSEHSAQRFHLALAAEGMGSWHWDARTNRVQWDEAMERVFGLTPDSFGCTYDAFLSLVHPDDRAGVIDQVSKAGDSGSDYGIEFRAVRPDGEVRWICDRGQVQFDVEGKRTGIIGVCWDVTGRWQIEDDLEASRRQVTGILESITDSFAAFDNDWKYTYVNEQGARLARLPKTELIGKKIWDVFPELEGTEFHTQAMRVKRDRVPTNFELYFVPSDAWFSIRMFPSQEGVIIYYRDNTQQKLAEQRLMVQNAVSAILVEAADFDEAGAKVLDAIGGNLGWAFGAMWTLDAKTSTLRCHHVWENPTYSSAEFGEVCRNLVFPPGVDLPGCVWRSGEAMWISDFSSEQRFPRFQIATVAQFRSAFAFPILVNGRILGVMEFFHVRIISPEKELLDTVTAIGQQMGQFFHRRQAEQDLRNSEAHNCAVLNTALDSIISIDENSRIFQFNPAAEKTFGFSREDALGQSIAELIIPPRWRSAHKAGIARYLETGTGTVIGSRIEITAMRADGSEFPIELAINRISSERPILFTAYLRDITARKDAEQTIRASEERYRSLVEATAAIVWHMPASGAFEEPQIGWSAFTGQTWEELKGWGWLDAVHEDDQAHTAEIWSQALAHHALYQVEHRLRRYDGVFRWMQVRAVPVLNADGSIREWVGIHTDTTDRRRGEEELREAKAAAEEANKAKSQFLASMSHELRTPLNAIIGYSEMLQEEVIELGASDFVPDLEKIQKAGRHLLSLINDVLDLSKIEAGRMDLIVEEFDLSEMIYEVVDAVKPLVQRNANSLEIEGDTQLGRMISDVTKVRQMLLNLFSNACKFTEMGTVRLALERVFHQGIEYIQFRISDTGIGISQEKLDRLFEPFSQADAATTRRYGGTGLRLALTRHLALLMRGSVWAESKVGKGSTFTLELPVSLESPPSLPLPSDIEDTPGEAAQQSILVVDDDAAARELIQRSLEREGFRTVAASNGPEALRLARHLRPTAITLDAMMPGMDGWSVLGQLKADQATYDIPVIMVTILEDRNLAYSLGAAEYLTKPIDRERLARVLRECCCEPPCPILVVDDEQDNRRLLRILLEREGWQVIESENGADAMERVSESAPSLILLDLLMPEMDGFETLAALKHNPDWRNIPIVVVTAKDLTAEDREKLRGSVQSVVSKRSLSCEELLKEINHAVKAKTSPEVK